VVIAVPLPIAIERHQEQVGALERFQHRSGVTLLEDRVAQRAGHPLENRSPGEEANVVRGHVGEYLRPQVVGDQTIAAAERRHAVVTGSPTPGRHRGEIQSRGPAFGALD
jgi:hypothetical protein